jgi:tRNA threonylcarbamoyladenosine biosynthesis protein TsaB
VRDPNQRLLLIDTCGETAGIALSVGDTILATHDLEPGRASAEIIAAIGQLLHQTNWQLTGLTAIGVVSGPGSFTGMRTGLAAAKGLCEAASLPLVTASRLAVLGHAAGTATAALDAGRGELYIREADHEFLCKPADLGEVLQGRTLAVAEQRIADKLATLLAPDCLKLRTLHVSDALPLLLRSLNQTSSEVFAEANYVREERDIYPRAAGK